MNRIFYEKKIHQLKKIAKKEVKKGRTDRALRIIDVCARILYEFNQTYVDYELEDLILQISKNLLKDTDKQEDKETSKVILFYDGFGLDNRGLAQIYLKALCKYYKVIYVTYARRKNNIPDTIKLLDTYNTIKVFIEEKERKNQIYELNRIIETFNPSQMLMYTFPNDVVVTTVYAHYAEKITRYQINLTDHAFWLGLYAMDKCIEFRDYGATISHCYRNIGLDRIVKLPIYPNIDYERQFEGFPFNIDVEKNRIVFSGGALYKTFGGDNKYYKIVEYILNKYSDTIFWYAGYGNQSEIEKLKRKYPKRVYLTKERQDLYQVLRHCYIYLSTYPISGGLMFQYAAMASRIPITLKYDQDTEGFLLEQERLNIEFDTLEALYEEIDKIFTDNIYKKQREDEIYAAVVKEDSFTEKLYRILNQEKIVQDIVITKMNVDKLRQEYWDRHSKVDFCQMLIRNDSKFLLRFFPVEYAIGLIMTIYRKVKAFYKL